MHIGIGNTVAGVSLEIGPGNRDLALVVGNDGTNGSFEMNLFHGGTPRSTVEFGSIAATADIANVAAAIVVRVIH